MNKNTINTVLLLFTLSLTGFLATQIFWISGSFKAAEESFRHMTNAGLRAVSQQMVKVVDFYTLEKVKNRIETDRSITIDTLISICGYQALMNHEFGHHQLHTEYEYGLIDHLTGKLHYSSASPEKNNLIIQSPYKRGLKSTFNTDRFSLVVWFPHEKMVMLRSQSYWLLILSCVLFTGIITGYIISTSRLRSQKRLAQIQRDFIDNTTHEFKTPLATISIAAEMILQHQKDMPDHQIERYVRIIYNENKRLQHQVEQVMQVSLLEKEEYSLEHTLLQPDRVVEKCLETSRLMMRNTGGSIEITKKCNCSIYADESHLTNIINNLIENGIKYSPGAPQLNISLTSTDTGVQICIEDKGIGIDSDQHEKIFDRMYRVPSGNLYSTPGTGIGLYYARKVARLHGGEIIVKSTLGKGSTFCLNLPYGRYDNNEKKNS